MCLEHPIASNTAPVLQKQGAQGATDVSGATCTCGAALSHSSSGCASGATLSSEYNSVRRLSMWSLRPHIRGNTHAIGQSVNSVTVAKSLHGIPDMQRVPQQRVPQENDHGR
mgnify:CR=1 FL=1